MKIRIEYIAILAIAFLSLPPQRVSAQDESTISKKEARRLAKQAPDTTYPMSYVDTVELKKVFILNDYSMIGVEYGASGSQVLFSPTKKQTRIYQPGTYGVYFTRYGKMFGYMPYFGIKAGLRMSHSGYKFKKDKETGITDNVDGANMASIKVADMPLMAVFHVDSDHFTAMASAGIYGGYRLGIERSGPYVSPELANSFNTYDHRFEYGLTGGVGMGLVFAPFEFQINAGVRYSWSTLYDPDYYHKDYYRFAYPLDFMVTAGLYFHLTKRTGKSKPQLRREAYNHVFANPER